MVQKILNIINGLQQQIGLLYLKNVLNHHMYLKQTKIILTNMMKKPITHSATELYPSEFDSF